jgi:hypothetical protein
MSSNEPRFQLQKAYNKWHIYDSKLGQRYPANRQQDPQSEIDEINAMTGLEYCNFDYVYYLKISTIYDTPSMWLEGGAESDRIILKEMLRMGLIDGLVRISSYGQMYCHITLTPRGHEWLSVTDYELYIAFCKDTKVTPIYEVQS